MTMGKPDEVGQQVREAAQPGPLHRSGAHVFVDEVEYTSIYSRFDGLLTPLPLDSSVPRPGQLCSDVTVKQDVFLLFHLHFCFRTLDASFFRVASTPYPDLTPQLVG